jgi:nucleoside-diphosphate-sugar epimerase
MESLTVFGSQGFVGSHFLRCIEDEFLERKVPFKIFTPYRDCTNCCINTKDVVNFISTVHNYNVFEDPHLDINTNLNVLVDTLENWRKSEKSEQGCYNFISSWFVYGGSTLHGAMEYDDCFPRGFYSITKYCAEQLLRSYCTTYDLNYRILRLGNVIGPGDKKVSKKKNAIQYMANQIKNNEDVSLYGDGTFYRDYIHVKDVARAIALVIEKGEPNEIYNIGNGMQWNFRDILYFLRRITNSSSKIMSVESAEFHKKVQAMSFYMNVQKLHNLGFHPEYLGEDLFKTLVD